MSLRTKRWTALAAGSTTALLMAGCGAAETPADTAAGGGGPTVLAGFYPLEWAASRVGGESASVSSLTPPGAEAHDLELTPQDVAALSEADLLVYIEGFQPALDEAAASQAGDAAWDVSEAAKLTLTAAAEEHSEEPAGDEAHSDEAPAEGEVVDPHFWLDPTRLADIGDALAERMAELDPDEAASYEENAAALRTDLEELDAEMQAALAGCTVDTMVTAHDAFGYLADRYGFEVIGISGLEPSQEPSPSELAEIADLVQRSGVTTVYTETLVDPAVADTVAAEAGVQTAVLDPIEGLTDESAGADYLEVMRANLDTLREGQSCP